jgi:hypothetical protein
MVLMVMAKARVEGKVLVLEEPLDLPDGSSVELEVRQIPSSEAARSARDNTRFAAGTINKAGRALGWMKAPEGDWLDAALEPLPQDLIDLMENGHPDDPLRTINKEVREAGSSMPEPEADSDDNSDGTLG